MSVSILRCKYSLYLIVFYIYDISMIILSLGIFNSLPIIFYNYSEF